MNKKKEDLTIWGTPKTNRTVHFANKVTPEFDETIRRQTAKAKCMITEMLELYQQAYIEKLEREKTEKRLSKEIKEKGEIICPQCEQKVYYDR